MQTAAVGYDQTTELWTLGGRPTVKPDTESQIAEDRHYVLTFEKGMYGYKVVEHYENADGVEIGTIETTEKQSLRKQSLSFLEYRNPE